MHVLVMSEHYQGALACIQSMGRAGHAVSVLAGRSPSANAYSRYVTKRIQPAAVDNSIQAKADALAAIVGSEGLDLVIPISDDDARIVSAASIRHPDKKTFVTSAPESLATASSKIATMEMAREIGIETPPSAVAQDRSGVADTVATLGLPIVIKVPVATASAGTFVARTRGDVKRIVAGLPAGPILVQGFIDGERVDITGFALDGEVLDAFGFRHTSDSKAGGTPVYAFSDSDIGSRRMLDAICRRLTWTGGIDLDMMRDKNGKLYLLEINPRFSGTLVFADKLGIDLPRYYVEAASGAEPHRPTAPAAGGVLFIAVVPNEVKLISGNPLRWQKRAADLRKSHRYVDNIYADDGPLMAAQMREASPSPGIRRGLERRHRAGGAFLRGRL